jgi:hypothetical protein
MNKFFTEKPKEVKPFRETKKYLAQTTLAVLVNVKSDIETYNTALENYYNLGGIDGLSEIMGWDNVVKNRWNNIILNNKK